MLPNFDDIFNSITISMCYSVCHRTISSESKIYGFCGHTVWTSLEQDLDAFVSAMGGNIEIQRIALLEQQAYDHDLAYVPVGPDDGSNHGTGFTSKIECQAEALEAEDLIEIIRQAFEQSLDMDLFEEQVASEAQMRKDALKLLRAQR